MKNTIWFITGIIIISLVFFIALNGTGDYWLSSEITSISAVVYPLAYMGFNLRKPIPLKIQLTAYLVILVIAGLSVIAFNQHKKMAYYQRNTLLAVRTWIGEGMIKDNVRKLFIKTLYEYNKKSQESLSLAKAYERARIGSDIQSDIDRLKKEGLKIFITSMSDYEIGIISQDTIALGWNEAFVNYNGQIGKLQFRAALNKEGIRYERQN